MKSHNKMADSMSEIHNISENVRVLGFSLTKINALYVQNGYLAIVLAVKFSEFRGDLPER